MIKICSYRGLVERSTAIAIRVLFCSVSFLVCRGAIADDFSLRCALNAEVSYGALGSDGFAEAIRLEISEADENLSFSGEGKDFNLTIDTRHHSGTRRIENRSTENVWKISRTDERGESISEKMIIVDRNTGQLAYRDSLYRADGKFPPKTTTITGECIAIDVAIKRF